MHLCRMRLAFDQARDYIPNAKPYILALLQEWQVLAAAVHH